MLYALATINYQGQAAPVIESGGEYWLLSEVAPELLQPHLSRGLLNIFDHWQEREPKLAKLAERLAGNSENAGRIEPPPRTEDFLAPLLYPNKVVLMGANYYDHLRNDAGINDFKKEEKIPMLFFKPPTTTLVGSGKSVRYPTQSKKFDWEIELALVIGKRARRVHAAEALNCVAGYTIGIDLSARDWQFHSKHLMKFDLFGGKGFDDSCPLGPRIVPARFVDPENLQLRLFVNGELKQNASTRDMIWSLGEQIEAMSEHVTLEPGDVILTGTPAGVGLATGTYLKVGDKIDADIDQLGRLSVQIV
jgi:2-keto-4-pentenoate hydratase/2-oxohepta-3-ene-1,7-dioic acid hydratase in catechol pathway